MAAHKKKIIVFLVVVALSSGSMVVCAAQSDEGESAKKLLDNHGSSFANDPNLTVGSNASVDTRELFYKMIVSVLVVIALGAATIYISKKLLPRFANLPGKRIKVVETVHLGPRKAVHLLKIGDQQLLIGSTAESITKLADVGQALAETDNS